MSEGKMFLTVADVQQILRVSRPVVYRLIKRREFKWIMIGKRGYRISRPSFEEWLEENACYNRDIVSEPDSFTKLCHNRIKTTK